MLMIDEDRLFAQQHYSQGLAFIIGFLVSLSRGLMILGEKTSESVFRLQKAL
jgi:hypothetical protein